MQAKPVPPWHLVALSASAVIATGLAVPSVAHDNDNDSRTKTPIKHVVVIFPENESFDHYFATYPVAANPRGEPKFVARDDTPAVNNLLSAGLLTKNPNLMQPFRYDRSEAYTCSLDHNYTDEQKAVNGGLNDMFVQATSRVGLGCRDDGSSVMGYFDGNTVTALWNYAQHYAMSDNSFDTNFGPSTPGALNLVSGMTGNAHLATTFAAGKVATFTPVTVTGDPDPALDDCGKDAGGTKTGQATVELQGRNVGDLLNAKGITWGWFQGGFAPTAPAVVNRDGSTATPAVCGASHGGHPGVPNPTALNGNTTSPPVDIHGAVADNNPHHASFQYYASTRNPHHVRPNSVAEIGHNGPANHQYDMTDFYAALKADRLPAVSYLKPANYQDEHPGNSDPLSFQTFLVDVINALQKSDEWRDTAVIVAYDDSDGWYDHMTGPVVSQSAFNTGTNNGSVDANDSYVPTLPLSSSTTPGNAGLIPTSGVCGNPSSGASSTAPRCGYGPRLPLLVISPWAKENFIDHTTTDQTASLAFIEYNWDVGFIDPAPLPVSQGGSFDRISGPILGMFDFNARPNLRRLMLDDRTGLVIGDRNEGGHDHDRDHD
ncbi:MAG TPA: alkaline phosphatase family protein, partial [Steroidobacteraceae bacterium]